MGAHAATAARPAHLVVGWTGHRELAAPEPVTAAVAAAFDRLAAEAAVRGRALVCVGSAAKGADLLFCEEALRRQIPLLVILPFAAARFEPAADAPMRARIDRVLAASNAVEVVRPLEEGDGAGFLEAGIRTVNDCDVLLAVWDRAPPKGPAGTGAIVGYARELARPLACIDPRNGATEWLRELPASGRTEYARPVDATANAPLSRADVAGLYATLDAAANRHARPARSLLFTIIWLHLLASAVMLLAQTAYPEFLHQGGALQALATPTLVGASLFKIGALLTALWLASRFRQPHHDWIDQRSRAELCRAFLAVWDLPRWAVRPPGAPLAALASLQRDLYVAWLLDAAPARDIESARQAYLHGVPTAGHATPAATSGRGRIASQLDYLRTHATRTRGVNMRLHGIAQFSTLAAIALGVVALALKPFDGEGVALSATALKSFGVLLPLVSAALLTYATAGDLKRRAERYHELAERLANLEQRIRSARSWLDLGRSVDQAEQLLLAEVAEWHAFSRFAGEPH